MSSTYLNDFIENAAGLASALIPDLAASKADRNGINTLAFALLQHGTCSLLLHGKAEPVFLRGMQAGGAFAQYLSYAPDDSKVTSDSRPFFAAVGCGYWNAAQAIAQLSRMTWNPPYEYEEDFLYVQFLMKHLFLGAPDVECQQIIDRHEQAAEGAEQARRDVCTALLSSDAALFDDALRRLLEDRREKVEAMIRRDAIPEEHWSWLRYFSVEGWALLKLAERKGMKTDPDFLHVPKSIRRGAPFAYDRQAWRTFDFSPSAVWN